MPVPPKITGSLCDVLFDAYVNKKMSTHDISKSSTELFGCAVSPASVYTSLIRHKVPIRSVSESVSLASTTLDQNVTHLSESMIEWIDGFLLGDGAITSVSKNRGTFRFSMDSVEQEWAKYAISGLTPYCPSEPKQSGTISIKRPRLSWMSKSLTHPDIAAQFARWYPDGKKSVPNDIRITPVSIMLWYLGDGSLSHAKGNFESLRFATCSFSISEINDVLIPKLNKFGINCIGAGGQTELNDVRVRVCPESIGRFFDLIGHESPIPCYAYKFDVPGWLYKTRLVDIVKTDQEKWRAIYHIRKGTVKCSSSPGGKMFLFDDEQATNLRLLLDDTGRDAV